MPTRVTSTPIPTRTSASSSPSARLSKRPGFLRGQGFQEVRSVQFSIRKIILGSLIAGSMAVPAMAEIKVGVIDYARLLEESPQAKVVQGALTSEFGPRYKALVAQEASLKTKSDQLQKDVATMTPDQ